MFIWQMCFSIVRCAQCDFVQRQMKMSNVTLREEEEEEFERARAIWFCWWCTRTSGNARATLHVSINKIAHMIFRVCHLISLVFVSACLRYFSCAISTLLVSSVLFFLFNIRILTSPRTVSVFALYMHIFHSVFLSHTAFSPKPNKPTGIRSLVIHFASIRFVWFFFSFRIVSFHCSSLLLLCLLFQPRSFHFCFCYLFFCANRLNVVCAFFRSFFTFVKAAIWIPLAWPTEIEWLCRKIATISLFMLNVMPYLFIQMWSLSLAFFFWFFVNHGKKNLAKSSQ